MLKPAALLRLLAFSSICWIARAECIGPETPCEAFAKANHVFVARVLESIPKETIDGKPSVVHVRMHVEKVFKGFAGREGQEIEFEQFLGETLVRPEQGKQFLVFARHDRLDRPYPSIMLDSCQGTRELDTRYSYDLGHIEALSHGRAPWALAGLVRDGAKPMKGVSDVLVHIDGPRQVEVRTGTEGTFLVPALPPGKYSLRVAHADYYWDPEWVKSVHVEKSGCAYTGFALAPNNFVQGRLLAASGKPIADALVFLRGLPTVWGEFPPGSRVRTAIDGAFVFKGILPGPYFLEADLGVLSPSGLAITDSEGRAYYPGSFDKTHAATIQVDRYSKAFLQDFRLPANP